MCNLAPSMRSLDRLMYILDRSKRNLSDPCTVCTDQKENWADPCALMADPFAGGRAEALRLAAPPKGEPSVKEPPSQFCLMCAICLI